MAALFLLRYCTCQNDVFSAVVINYINEGKHVQVFEEFFKMQWAFVACNEKRVNQLANANNIVNEYSRLQGKNGHCD